MAFDGRTARSELFAGGEEFSGELGPDTRDNADKTTGQLVNEAARTHRATTAAARNALRVSHAFMPRAECCNRCSYAGMLRAGVSDPGPPTTSHARSAFPSTCTPPNPLPADNPHPANLPPSMQDTVKCLAQINTNIP